MLLMQNHQESLRLRLHTIGIPNPLITPFIREMVKWETSSGPEWTIKRLKGLKVDIIRIRAGLQPLSWVRKNRKGNWYGVVGSLRSWSSKSESNFRRTVQAFMAYSFYILPGLSESQRAKFLAAIQSSPEDGLSQDFHRSFAQTIKSSIRTRSVSGVPGPLVAYQGSLEKKAPCFSLKRSVVQDSHILREVDLLRTYAGAYLYGKYQRIFDPILEGTDSQAFYRMSAEVNKGYPLELHDHAGIRGGRICFLQEPGGKLRSIASPYRLWQEALRPFGRSLYSTVASLPWDCTFDQQKAIPYIQEALSKGQMVHSIDLSSATDMFPLSLQLTALRAVFNKDDHDYINLFEEISRSNWESPIGTLKWTKGQPLGLYPSFAAFTLTHGLLLLHLNGGRHNGEFYVVGDDVVILNDQLRDSYVSMLSKMGCPWSPDKSLSSCELSEFAGQIITSSMVIPQMKWRELSDDNFLDIVRMLGKRARVLLTGRQKRVFDEVQHYVEPVGLNFSYPGSNLVGMIDATLDFYQPEKRILGSLMGLRGRIHRHLSETPSQGVDPQKVEALCATFDEKVVSVLRKTVFGRFWTAYDALSSLPQALGLTELPTEVLPPSRVTTLQRYERLIQKPCDL